MKTIRIKIIGLIMLLVLIIILGCEKIPDKTLVEECSNENIDKEEIEQQGGLPGGPGIGIPDPAAFYCKGVGYKYNIINGAGTCIFPDGSECEEWAFYRGQCGQKWSYCVQHGYDLIVKSDGKDPYSSSSYSVCIDKKSRNEIGSVTNLMQLERKISSGCQTQEVN